MARISEQTRESPFITVDIGPVALQGDLVVPGHAQGMVLFAHGSGSGRFSPRNRHVAEVFQEQGLGTFLVDLLTAEEEAVDIHTRHLRFNIPMLADRLVGLTDWLRRNPSTRGARIGYFGSSTGAAAALVAAAERPEDVAAVVSRGGRPDMAGSALSRVKTPTLLIVGGNDYPVTDLNRDALDQLHVKKKLVVVPGASHLFEEPGALDEVARLAADWFADHLKWIDRPAAMGPV